MIRKLYFEAKLDKVGRIVVPQPVRQQYGIEAGDSLRFIAVDGGILLTPVRDTEEN